MKSKMTPAQKKNQALGDALMNRDKATATKLYNEIKKGLTEGDRKEVEKQLKAIKAPAKKAKK